MNTKNNYLEWHFPSLIHCKYEVANDFKDFRIFYSFFYFVIFIWEFFHDDWEKKILFSVGNMTQYRL